MRFLLDANVFIQAHRLHYPFDVFPGFWRWLERENSEESIGSIDWVYNEIKDGDDDPLAEWAKAQDASKWFLKCDDEATQKHFADLANEIMANGHYTQSAKAEFLSVADSWLIAKARALNLVVVTEERSNPQKRNQIFIPDICKVYEIPCINTVGLIRALGGQFG